MTDSIASPTVPSTSPRMAGDCPRPSSIGPLRSPAVHSTTHAALTQQGAPPSPAMEDSDMKKPIGVNSRASSFDSLADSPATVIAANKHDKDITDNVLSPYMQDAPSTDANKLKSLKEYSSTYGCRPPTPTTVVAPSPLKKNSINPDGSVHGTSFDHSKMHMSQFKPVQSPSVGTTVSTAVVSTSVTSVLSQAGFSDGTTYSSANRDDSVFQRPASVGEKPTVAVRPIDSPFDLGYSSMGSASVCTESHYGSMSSLDRMSTTTASSTADMGPREKVMSYLHKSIPANVPNFIPPANVTHMPNVRAASLPDSPPQDRLA